MNTKKTSSFGMITFRPAKNDYLCHRDTILDSLKVDDIGQWFQVYAAAEEDIENPSHIHIAFALKEDDINMPLTTFKRYCIDNLKKSWNCDKYLFTDWKCALKTVWGKVEKGDTLIKSLAYVCKQQQNSYTPYCKGITEEMWSEIQTINGSYKLEMPMKAIKLNIDQYLHKAELHLQSIFLVEHNNLVLPKPQEIIRALSLKGFIICCNRFNLEFALEQLIVATAAVGTLATEQ